MEKDIVSMEQNLVAIRNEMMRHMSKLIPYMILIMYITLL